MKPGAFGGSPSLCPDPIQRSRLHLISGRPGGQSRRFRKQRIWAPTQPAGVASDRFIGPAHDSSFNSHESRAKLLRSRLVNRLCALRAAFIPFVPRGAVMLGFALQKAWPRATQVPAPRTFSPCCASAEPSRVEALPRRTPAAWVNLTTGFLGSSGQTTG